jgi:hypothetical protein
LREQQTGEGAIKTSWIQTSSATVDLKAAISSAMASAGVLHQRVFLGRLFIRFATSFSHVWLPHRLRAIAAVFLPTSRQLTADRARRAMQKLANQTLTAAPIMLG